MTLSSTTINSCALSRVSNGCTASCCKRSAITPLTHRHCYNEPNFSMRLMGLLLLLGGWMIVLAAIALLPPGASRASFVLVALGVEGLGLALVFRSHWIPGRERR